MTMMRMEGSPDWHPPTLPLVAADSCVALLTFCYVSWFFGAWQHTFMHHADTNADGEVSQESCQRHSCR